MTTNVVEMYDLVTLQLSCSYAFLLKGSKKGRNAYLLLGYNTCNCKRAITQRQRELRSIKSTLLLGGIAQSQGVSMLTCGLVVYKMID